MSKNHNKVCSVLNYIEHPLYTVTGCVSISTFTSLIGNPLALANSTVGWKICVITPGTKK